MKVLSFLLLHLYCVNAYADYNSVQIKDLQISKCDSKSYPISVSNVLVQLGSKPKVKVSGSMSTQVDLVDPILASVSLKRNIWGIWIDVPCENNLGSCTYEDLCAYGYPENVKCPPQFTRNNVPCRCPIAKGNYTIKPSITLGKTHSILSGKYKGSITLSHKTQLLSCYNIYFTLFDANDVYSVIQI